MSINSEPQFRVISVEDSLLAEERAANFYTSAVLLVHTLYTEKGLDPSQALSPHEIEYAEAQKAADAVMATYGGSPDERTLRPVMVGAQLLEILTQSDWGDVATDAITRPTELMKELPGDTATRAADTERDGLPIAKKGVSPQDIANMVRKALATEDSQQ